MERRWTTRTEMRVELDVATDTATVSGCYTRDIGLGGAYVVTSNGAGFIEGEDVELMFKLTNAEGTEAHKIRAKVVRTSGEGAGVMFRDFDAIAFRSLQKVMRSKESVA